MRNIIEDIAKINSIYLIIFSFVFQSINNPPLKRFLICNAGEEYSSLDLLVN